MTTNSQAIIDRIKTIPANPFRFVGGARDFVAALDQLKATPSLFVLPSRKVPGPDGGLTGLIRQHVVMQFSFVIGVGVVGPGGAGDLDKIEELEQQLIDIMVGWQPEDFTEPFTYSAGQMVGVDVDKSAMFWGSDFAAGFYLRKVTST